MNMRLLGSRTIREIVPDMVDASNIHMHTVPVPIDNLYEGNCASFRSVFFISSILPCMPKHTVPVPDFFPHFLNIKSCRGGR